MEKERVEKNIGGNGEAVSPDEVLTEDLGAFNSLATIEKAEIDIQIATAKRYPRDITSFKKQVELMATLDEDTAASMFYVIPRAGKQIEGPSIRFAEVVGSAWGNMRYGARIIETADRYVVAQGVAHDLEKNVFCAINSRRRIIDSKGRRYGDDMIQTTANAANSVALRSAIFRVVPFALVRHIYELAKQTSVGKNLTMEKRRENALEAFRRQKFTDAEVLRIIKRKGVDDITIEDLINLKGILTALKDGDVTRETLFADLDAANGTPSPPTGGSKTDQLRSAMEAKRKAAEATSDAPPSETADAAATSGEAPPDDAKAEPEAEKITTPRKPRKEKAPPEESAGEKEGEPLHRGTYEGVPIMVMSGVGHWKVMQDHETFYYTTDEKFAEVAKSSRFNEIACVINWELNDQNDRVIKSIRLKYEIVE